MAAYLKHGYSLLTIENDFILPYCPFSSSLYAVVWCWYPGILGSVCLKLSADLHISPTKNWIKIESKNLCHIDQME